MSDAASTAEKPADAVLNPTTLLRERLARFGVRLATGLLADVFLLFEGTLDVRVYGRERLLELKRAGATPLLVLWHGQGLIPVVTFRDEHLCLYASHTRDPNYARVLQVLRWCTLRFVEGLGYRVLDASQFKSESRGVMQFVEILRGGTGSVIAADGPGGPIYKSKPGPAFLAKKAGVTLLPVGAAISSGLQLDQWDRFEVPSPFARAVIVLGEPISISSTARDAELEQSRRRLERAMIALMDDARQKLIPPDSEPIEQIQAENS